MIYHNVMILKDIFFQKYNLYVNKLNSHYRVKMIDGFGLTNLTSQEPIELRKKCNDFCLGHDCKSREIIRDSRLVGLMGLSDTNYLIQRWWLTSTLIINQIWIRS
jgi:hypothetical protein